MNYTSRWKRVLGAVIDFGLMFVILIASGVVNTYVSVFLGYVVALAGLWFYSAYMEASAFQGTVGKKILGLTVTDLDGNSIDISKATARFVLKIFLGIPLAMGPLFMMLTEKRQALYDIVLGTVVVEDSEVTFEQVAEMSGDIVVKTLARKFAKK